MLQRLLFIVSILCSSLCSLQIQAEESPATWTLDPLVFTLDPNIANDYYLPEAIVSAFQLRQINRDEYWNGKFLQAIADEFGSSASGNTCRSSVNHNAPIWMYIFRYRRQ